MAKHNKGTRERTTVYFERHLHRALRQKAAAADTSISELVNDALRAAFDEDAEDLAAIEARRNEPDLKFEDVVRDMKKRGRF